MVSDLHFLQVSYGPTKTLTERKPLPNKKQTLTWQSRGMMQPPNVLCHNTRRPQPRSHCTERITCGHTIQFSASKLYTVNEFLCWKGIVQKSLAAV